MVDCKSALIFAPLLRVILSLPGKVVLPSLGCNFLGSSTFCSPWLFLPPPLSFEKRLRSSDLQKVNKHWTSVGSIWSLGSVCSPRVKYQVSFDKYHPHLVQGGDACEWNSLLHGSPSKTGLLNRSSEGFQLSVTAVPYFLDRSRTRAFIHWRSGFCIMKLLADVISSKLQIYPFFSLQKVCVCEINRILPLCDLWPTFDQLLSGSHKPLSDVACVWMTIDKPAPLCTQISLCILYTKITSGALIYCCHSPHRDQFVQPEQDLLLLNGVNNSMWTWERNYHWLSPF